MIQGETGRTLSYGDFLEKSLKLAKLLEDLSVQSQERVAILLQNSPDFSYAIGGILFQGGVAGPINILLKPQELEYILNHQEARVLISEAEFFPLLQEIRNRLSKLEFVIELSSKHPNGLIVHNLKDPSELRAFYQNRAEQIKELPKDLLSPGRRILTWEMLKKKSSPAQVAPHDPALILYTSGTTGKPKGALLSHEAIIDELGHLHTQVQADETDVLLSCLPLFHIFGLVFTIFGPFHIAASAVTLKSFSPETYIQALLKYPISTTIIVPTIAFILLQIAEKLPQIPDLPSLKRIICGASALPMDVHKKLENTFKLKVYEGYGLTEVSMAGCLNITEGEKRKWGSVGKPAAGYNDIAIFNGQSKALPAREVGEVVIRGKNIMMGYLKDPEGTKEALKDGWLHTGDLGYLDEDGYLYIIGRMKDMIIVGGENVYPREIEEILALIPQIAEVAVIGLDHEKYGEEVVACIALKGSGIDEEKIIAFAKEKLAPFKVPSKVVFLDKLPRNASGKVLKNELKTRFASGAN